jgi:uncharacterized 2Fe-2S/4Fe-4S cluster protein (DUF4445 family)
MMWMPELSILLNGQWRTLEFRTGASLRDLLDEADLRLRTACLGHGACGLCRVRIEGASPPPPRPAERLHLSESQLAAGVRLACQLRPEHDLRLELLNPAPPSRWQTLPVAGEATVYQGTGHSGIMIPVRVHHPLAVAVDIGTSNIRLALIDLRLGRWLTLCRGANPQGQSGADVLSRLSVAVKSQAQAQRLSRQLVEAVGEALAESAERQGIDPQRVVYLALVANTSMLALLTGDRIERLLDPHNWTRRLECRQPDGQAWIDAWRIHPHAQVELIQPLAGFVGSDLLAGLLATRFTQGPSPALFVDLGTNSEVALWDGRRLWVTSAAGGPAFEVSGYSHGMPAEAGAIYRVHRNAVGELGFRVIGNREPGGICGSGLLDLVARLREQGLLNPIGRFTQGATYQLPGTGDLSIDLSHKDVDNLQQAKAGISAAVQVLCQQSGVPLTGLARICVAGEFGRHLDVESAVSIGLLPPVVADRVELLADAALLGCSAFILDDDAVAQLDQTRQEASLINLALVPEFESLFVESLYLRPMQSE